MADHTVTFSAERMAAGAPMCEAAVTIGGVKRQFDVQGYTDAATRKVVVIEKIKRMKLAGAFEAASVHPSLPATTKVSDDDIDVGAVVAEIE